MDAFLEHVRRSSEEVPPPEREAFVLRFTLPGQGWMQEQFETRRTSHDVLSALWQILVNYGFTGKGPDFVRRLALARFERTYDRHEDWLGTLNRLHEEKLILSMQIEVTVEENGRTTLRTDRRLPTLFAEIQRHLRSALERTSEPASRQTSRYRHHPVLGPGQELEEPFTGNLRDYSGCASPPEIRDLEHAGEKDNRVHVLPLGRPAFARPDEPLQPGAPVYLANFNTKAPMIYNGALLCAPQNSGKTQLIIRWAKAANAAGYSVFLIDVKGNLYRKLRPALTGKVYYFSTDPDEVSDRINFLSGISLAPRPKADRGPGADPEGASARIDPKQSRRIRQLVNALFPSEGWESGENLFYYQNRCSWLTAILHILKLFEFYYPEEFEGRTADLSDAYALASDEAMLLSMIADLWRMEQIRVEEGGTVLEPRLAYWVNELSILLEPDSLPEGLPRGQRRADDTYRNFTQSLLMALLPFSINGTLYRKICDLPLEREDERGELFTFEQLGGSEPVTMILSAREQDLDDAVTVTSLAIKKLQQFLFERFKQDHPRPILLLLDETRRIRSFKPGEYVTFAREAKAGCVLVYQSLDQIGDERAIMELLENVGTQIYLKSLVGNTARHFISILPKRFRPTFSLSSSTGTEGQSSAVQSGYELVDYLTTNELYHLPAGEWPALVYIKDHVSRKPFLVDMTEPSLPPVSKFDEF